jgi:hypothetical protein
VFGHRQYLGLIEVAEMVYFIYSLVCGIVVLFCLGLWSHLFMSLSCFRFVVPFSFLFLVCGHISGLLFRVAEKFDFF